MCGSMIDIQSPTAKIRRGKKEERQKSQGKNIMSASAMQGGHKKHTFTNQKKSTTAQNKHKLECGPMPNVVAALLNTDKRNHRAKI